MDTGKTVPLPFRVRLLPPLPVLRWRAGLPGLPVPPCEPAGGGLDGSSGLKSPAARLPRGRNGVAPIMQRRDEARASVRCKCGACPAAYGDFMELFSEKRGVKTGASLSLPSASVFPGDVPKNKRHLPRLARMARRGKMSSGRLRPRALALPSSRSANHWMQVASPMTP